jgi:hypothetical protein
VFDEGDAQLLEALQEAHPERTYEITRDYPNEWVVVVVTCITGTHPITAGRVFVHAPERQTFQEQLGRIRAKHPELRLTVTFTGTYLNLLGK